MRKAHKMSDIVWDARVGLCERFMKRKLILQPFMIKEIKGAYLQAMKDATELISACEVETEKMINQSKTLVASVDQNSVK